MDINEQIAYKWTLGWEGMSKPSPNVNCLLKAMIEKNVDEMESLFLKGANIEKTDTETFQRVLYHVLDDYDVISCLIKHGFTSFNGAFQKKLSYYANDNCIDPSGYICGLPGWAWHLSAYDVVKLLVDEGFKNMLFLINGESYDAEELCFQSNDLETIKIFLENGEAISHYSSLCREYPDSKVTEYLESVPIIKRRSLLLAQCLFSSIPEPEFVKVGLFGRKAAKEKNARILTNYEDQLAMQNRFIREVGVDRWKKEAEEKERASKAMVEIAREISRTKKVKK